MSEAVQAETVTARAALTTVRAADEHAAMKNNFTIEEVFFPQVLSGISR